VFVVSYGRRFGVRCVIFSLIPTACSVSEGFGPGRQAWTLPGVNWISPLEDARWWVSFDCNTPPIRSCTWNPNTTAYSGVVPVSRFDLSVSLSLHDSNYVSDSTGSHGCTLPAFSFSNFDGCLGLPTTEGTLLARP